MKNAQGNQEAKRMAGEAAVSWVQEGMTVGIGTGSTVAFFIAALGRRIREESLHMYGVPTSFMSRVACGEAGIICLDPSAVRSLDLTVDGADEIDPALNAIKGGGAAHTIEKIIASLAQRFVLIADASKLTPRLGSGFPLPVELMPQAWGLFCRCAEEAGLTYTLRQAVRKDGPVITDNGNFIVDVQILEHQDIQTVDRLLLAIPGVVDTGLFTGIATEAVVSDGERVWTLRRPDEA